MGKESQWAELLEELRKRMADLRPENVEKTMSMAGLLRESLSDDPVIEEELQGYLRILGRTYREWKRDGKLPR